MIFNGMQDFLKEFQDVFPKDVPHGLPPLRATLPNRAAYRKNPKEAKEIQKQVGKLIEKGWVRESMNPCDMPMILVPKKDGTWRMYTNCRPINNIVVRYRHPISRLDEVREGDEWKKAFKTTFGVYEWLVMLFGLTNVPSTFMRLMNHVLRCLIGKCVVVYFDDTLIYSTCLDDHLFHVKNVLEILRKETLFSNLKKCVFCTYEVTFLGFVVGSNAIKVDEEKVKAIQDWPTPKTVVEIRSFQRLASFYRRFVKDFSTFVAPLNKIVKNSVGFKWEESEERTFQSLKERLT
ncbi:hypothetical protein CR513_34057, partial [Mucuna pruriens]